MLCPVVKQETQKDAEGSRAPCRCFRISASRYLLARYLAASGSWTGALLHRGRLPCRQQEAWRPGERCARRRLGLGRDLRAARQRRPEPVRGCACGTAPAGGTRRECACGVAAAAETRRGGACGAVAEMCVLPLKSYSIWIILSFFIQ